MNEDNKVVVDEELGMNPPEPSEQETAPKEDIQHEAVSEEPKMEEKPDEEPKPEETKTYTYEDVEKKLRKDSNFMKLKGLPDKVFEYFKKRCSEDSGLAQDIMQEHKTWEKCYKFCEGKARKQAASGATSAMVDGNDLLEWIEDYYRMDDKAEEEEKARKEAERKKKWEEDQKKRKAEAAKKKAEDRKKPAKTSKEETKSEEKPKPAPKPKKKSDEIDGQLNIFDMFG